jgi:hypothetical protein
MSGVEAAGFVLAAFPLLLSALGTFHFQKAFIKFVVYSLCLLENYRKTAEVFSDWWKFKREYRKCKDEIYFHQLSFEQNLEKYLLPLIVDDEELELLISDPGGEIWHNPELENKLKARLPRAYDLYLSTIVQMNETMAELHEVLGSEKLYLQGDEMNEVSEVFVFLPQEGYPTPHKVSSRHIHVALDADKRRKFCERRRSPVFG